MEIKRSWGEILLSLWLIAMGMVAVFSLTFEGIVVVLGIIAILAGLLRLLGK